MAGGSQACGWRLRLRRILLLGRFSAVLDGVTRTAAVDAAIGLLPRAHGPGFIRGPTKGR